MGTVDNVLRQHLGGQIDIAKIMFEDTTVEDYKKLKEHLCRDWNPVLTAMPTWAENYEETGLVKRKKLLGAIRLYTSSVNTNTAEGRMFGRLYKKLKKSIYSIKFQWTKEGITNDIENLKLAHKLIIDINAKAEKVAVKQAGAVQTQFNKATENERNESIRIREATDAATNEDTQTLRDETVDATTFVSTASTSIQAQVEDDGDF